LALWLGSYRSHGFFFTIPASFNLRVVLNRPFVFLIREKTTGTILFLGQLMKP